MNVLFLILTLAGDPATCPMHAKHTASHHEAVDERGDRVMGFSHDKTKHSFKLHDDGGAVEVRANDEADAESVDAIRAHLKEIAKDFTAGNFAKPKEIHDREHEGVGVMRKLGSRISYVYEELERGGRVRIKTTEPSGIEAVHQFLRFQIEDHRTGEATHLH